jgi:hypothetical protein
MEERSVPVSPEHQPGPHPVRVLYIGGAGRSGSTLLDLILGEIPGLFAAGELKYIWDRGVRDNELCGCGERFLACPFWTPVGKRAFGGWDRVDVDEVLALERAVDNHRSIPLMSKPGLSARYAARLEKFVAVLERLYAAVAEVSGATAIVDSTKRPSTAFLLSKIPAIDLRFVQLVRDSRGVAYSWSKRVKRPEVTDGVDFMPRYDSVKAGARWMANNSLFHVLAASGVPGIRVRYESLIASPRREVERIVRHAGVLVERETLDFLDQGEVDLATNHIVAGNPLRLGRRSLDLRLDDAWRAQMDRRQRSLVLLLTWPLLLRYGYLSEGRAGRSADADRIRGDVAPPRQLRR